MKRKRLEDAMGDRLPDWWLDRFGRAATVGLYQARKRTAAMHRQLMRGNGTAGLSPYEKDVAKRRARGGVEEITLFGVPVERKRRRDGVLSWEYVRY